MPLATAWIPFDKEKVRSEQDGYGVYWLGDSDGETVYVGWGRVLSRLLTHLPDGQDPYPCVRFFRAEQARSPLEMGQRHAAELEKHRRAYGVLPRFNRRRSLGIRAIR